jgi:3-isopropylmalate/(R)-2-methylmalate dehydratase small subunit
VDLESSRISDDHGLVLEFGIDPYRRDCLLRGLDEIALTLLQEDRIAAYERAHRTTHS